MPRLILEGDEPSLKAIRTLFLNHPTITVLDERHPASQDTLAQLELMRSPAPELPPVPVTERYAGLPSWCVLPSNLQRPELPDVMVLEAKQLIAATDAGTAGNPATTGLAAIFYRPSDPAGEGHGWVEPSHNITNNQGELCAATSALLYALNHNYGLLTLHLDSEYVYNNARRMDERRSAGLGIIKNFEHWELFFWALDEYRARRGQLTLNWVRGHQGHPMNERADTLAGKARKNQKYYRQIYAKEQLE